MDRGASIKGISPLRKSPAEESRWIRGVSAGGGGVDFTGKIDHPPLPVFIHHGIIKVIKQFAADPPRIRGEIKVSRGRHVSSIAGVLR